VRESQAAGRDERARFQRGIRNAAISGIRPTPTRLAVDYALARSLFYKKKEKARERERERDSARFLSSRRVRNHEPSSPRIIKRARVLLSLSREQARVFALRAADSSERGEAISVPPFQRTYIYTYTDAYTHPHPHIHTHTHTHIHTRRTYGLGHLLDRLVCLPPRDHRFWPRAARTALDVVVLVGRDPRLLREDLNHQRLHCNESETRLSSVITILYCKICAAPRSRPLGTRGQFNDRRNGPLLGRQETRFVFDWSLISQTGKKRAQQPHFQCPFLPSLVA